MDGAAGAADVDARPDVLLLGQDADAAAPVGMLQGQLLQRFRHVAITLVHQPYHRVAGADPVAAVHRRAQYDRPPVAPIPVPTSQALTEHLRRRILLATHHRQARVHRPQHTPEVSRPLLPVLHRLHGALDAH